MKALCFYGPLYVDFTETVVDGSPNLERIVLEYNHPIPVGDIQLFSPEFIGKISEITCTGMDLVEFCTFDNFRPLQVTCSKNDYDEGDHDEIYGELLNMDALQDLRMGSMPTELLLQGIPPNLETLTIEFAELTVGRANLKQLQDILAASRLKSVKINVNGTIDPESSHIDMLAEFIFWQRWGAKVYCFEVERLLPAELQGRDVSWVWFPPVRE